MRYFHNAMSMTSFFITSKNSNSNSNFNSNFNYFEWNRIGMEWNGIESVVSSVCLWCPEIKWMRICWLYFYFLFCRSTFTCDMWFEFTYDSCVRALLVRHCEWMKTRKYCTGDKHTVTVKNFTTIQMRSRFHCYVLYILLVWGHTVDELWKKLNENGG